EITNLEMQVRAGRIARAAHAADKLPGTDNLPAADIDRTEMPGERSERPVRQHDSVAVAPTVPAGKNHHTAVRRLDWRAHRGGQIDTRVPRSKAAHDGVAVDGIRPEGAADVGYPPATAGLAGREYDKITTRLPVTAFTFDHRVPTDFLSLAARDHDLCAARQHGFRRRAEQVIVF